MKCRLGESRSGSKESLFVDVAACKIEKEEELIWTLSLK